MAEEHRPEAVDVHRQGRRPSLGGGDVGGRQLARHPGGPPVPQLPHAVSAATATRALALRDIVHCDQNPAPIVLIAGQQPPLELDIDPTPR